MVVINVINGRVVEFAKVVGEWSQADPRGGEPETGLILRALRRGKPSGGKWVAPKENVFPLDRLGEFDYDPAHKVAAVG